MDLKAVDEYIKSIQDSMAKINGVIASKPDSQYVGRVNYAVNQIGTEMQFKSSEFATNNIVKAFESGEQKTNGILEVNDSAAGENVKQVFAENNVSINKNVYALNTFSELSKATRLVTDSVLRLVNGVIAGNSDLTMFDLQKTLQAELEREALATGTPFNVTYSNGRKVSFESYAKMVARSSMIESFNVGMFSRAEALGNDLVNCTEYGSTCPICGKYEGRVYSVSGKSTKYPPLYGTALKKGYSLIHPNCRHEFIPFNEQFYEDSELKELQKKSNAPFKDDRTERERELYAKGQALNQKLREEQIEYNNFKTQFGDAMPYKTLGAFRRAKRTGSERYNDLKQLITQ